MTIQQFLRKHPSDEATDILAHVLKLDKIKVLLSNARIPPQVVNEASRMLKQYEIGMPLAYILGYKYFYDLKFAVNRNVLIPRPESEWLVEQGVEYLRKHPGAKKMLDVGTGSGCLIISLAHATRTSGVSGMRNTRPSNGAVSGKIHWVASDVSSSALAVAKRNSRAHKTSIKLIQSNLFGTLKGKFDFIMANLPYVPRDVYEQLRAGLKYEPKLALTDPEENGSLIFKFLASIPEYLTDTGLAVMEIDPRHKPKIEKFIKRNKLPLQLAFYRDYNKLWRYATIKKFPSK